MGIVFYEPPPSPKNEARRERAVEVSGALAVRDDAVLGGIVLEARRRFHTATAAIAIIHGDYQHLIAAAGLRPGLYGRRTSLCGHAVAGDQRIFQLPDLPADPRFCGNPWVNGDEGKMAFYAGALLCDADSQALGTLCITDVRPRAPLSDAERAELIRLADRVQDRIERLRDDAPPPRRAAR